ncbi:hypothetical protein F2Q69_00022201 [Brassica cretica]|uniref:Uncharacterized protein n=1 Tax=Brassica cretica TaxID=69181 RepID=A0A8S9QDS9_BRACR|nr:hypothetical protein F2Q69_00022201 [Brassica cretica]
MNGLMSYRRFGRARLLRSDRAERTLGRYVATELGSSSVATCLRTLVEGIKPFVVRRGVKMEDYELSSHARILAKRQILGSRIKVFDTMPRDVRDHCAGFRARPRFSAYMTCMVGTEHLSKDNF